MRCFGLLCSNWIIRGKGKFCYECLRKARWINKAKQTKQLNRIAKEYRRTELTYMEIVTKNLVRDKKLSEEEAKKKAKKIIEESKRIV